MTERMFGIETEYALTGLDRRSEALDGGRLLHRLMRLVRQRFAFLSDGTDQGVFLQNGARFYVDCGNHPEFSTPETTNPWEAVRYIQAGERMLANLAAELAVREPAVAEILFLRCNVDYGGTGSTWGCHESYLHRSDPGILPEQLIPHLVSRVVYAGAGGFNSLLFQALQFTLSPRVWHLVRPVSQHSTGSRGVFHTKNETLASHGYHRLHILCGESLCSETANWLKIGTTALVVALIDGGVRPGDALQLKLPLAAMRRFASDPRCCASASTVDGKRLTAIAIQRHYLALVETHVGAAFMPSWAGEVCERWGAMLDRLEQAPESVSATLDWAIKLALYQERARRRGIAWESLLRWSHIATKLARAVARSGCPHKRPLVEAVLGAHSPVPDDVKRLTPYLRRWGLSWDGLRPFVDLRRELFEIDTRYGQLGDRGIFNALDQAGVLVHRVPGVDNIEQAIENPPQVGRARLRGESVKRLSGNGGRYLCGWQGLRDRKSRRAFDLSDPFAANGEWRERIPAGDELDRLRDHLEPSFHFRRPIT